MQAVRMGELKVSATAGEELAAIGLGSCIGLALVDRATSVAGLAHVVLPDSAGAAGPAGKFADLAVPELIATVVHAGAQKRRLEAVLVGGAKMFALGGGLDIGARNEAAVRAALQREGIHISAAETGGGKGRTMRVVVGELKVSSQEAGGTLMVLLGSGASGTPASRPAIGLRPRIAGAQA